MRIKVNDAYIFISILLLTLSHCNVFINTTKELIFEYGGYTLLLTGIIVSYFTTNFEYRKKNTTITIAVVFVLMSIGILVQNLEIMRKTTLVFTVLAIVIVSIMSENFLTNFAKIKVMAYACLTGVIISMVLCLTKGVPMIRITSEPTFGLLYFFNGGIRDKNISNMMIAIIMSLYIYSNEKGYYKKTDKIIILIALIVLFVSNSRGAWIEFLIFLLMINYKKIKKITKQHRRAAICIILLIAIPIVIYLFKNYILKSETFLFRYRGLTNYISKFGSDTYHMLFGNAELAYGPREDYALNIRRATGLSGTIEMSWLNILIKSGILGIVAYVIIFIRAFVTIIKCNNLKHKTIYLAVTVTLLSSSFTAIYIQSIHGLFGIYCYLIMAYYSGMIRRNNYYKKVVNNKEIKNEVARIEYWHS